MKRYREEAENRHDAVGRRDATLLREMLPQRVITHQHLARPVSARRERNPSLRGRRETPRGPADGKPKVKGKERRRQAP